MSGLRLGHPDGVPSFNKFYREAWRVAHDFVWSHFILRFNCRIASGIPFDSRAESGTCVELKFRSLMARFVTVRGSRLAERLPGYFCQLLRQNEWRNEHLLQA